VSSKGNSLRQRCVERRKSAAKCLDFCQNANARGERSSMSDSPASVVLEVSESSPGCTAQAIVASVTHRSCPFIGNSWVAVSVGLILKSRVKKKTPPKTKAGDLGQALHCPNPHTRAHLVATRSNGKHKYPQSTPHQIRNVKA